MTAFKWLAYFALSGTIAPVQAKPHCPGNVTSLRFHPGHGSQIIAPVMINRTGPYNFLVDTGAQVTIIDRSLADSLHLGLQGTAQIVGIGFHAAASFAQTDSLELGSQTVAGLRVIVRSAAYPKGAGLEVRGILGGDFLSHFDVLIDNAHQLLCLDDTGALRPEMKGNQIGLEKLDDQPTDSLIPQPPVLAVHLSGLRASQRLLLDSGANVALLYGGEGLLPVGASGSAPLRGSGAGGGNRNFVALAAQDLRIGAFTFHQVSFLALREGKSDLRPGAADGVLTTGIFRRVFISYVSRFVILEPWLGSKIDAPSIDDKSPMHSSSTDK
jgi:hypothetical protein